MNTKKAIFKNVEHSIFIKSQATANLINFVDNVFHIIVKFLPKTYALIFFGNVALTKEINVADIGAAERFYHLLKEDVQ